jgi:hypothetical protein
MKWNRTLIAVPTLLLGLSSCSQAASKALAAEPADASDASSSASQKINWTVYVVNKTYLDTPVIYVSDNGTVDCAKIDNAKSYILEYLKEETEETARIEVASFPYKINFTQSGVYSVRVAAVPYENSLFVQSKFSDYFQVISPIKSQLPSPKNIRVINNNEIVFDEVTYAGKYEISIDDKIIETSENSYKYDFLPGTPYSLKARARIYENVFLSDSDWSDNISFKYNVDFSTPTDLAISSKGELTWNCSNYCASAGFTIKAENIDTSKVTNIYSNTTKADLTSLEEGTYDVSVMASGIGDNPSSDYSSSVSLNLANAAYFDASSIASSFTSCNDTTATYLKDDGVASMRSGRGWGGLYTPAFSVDYGKSPLMRVAYKEIGFGYMGGYYFNNQTTKEEFHYQNDVYVKEKEYDVTLIYEMNKNAVGNVESMASGVVDGVSALIGFTGAPDSTSNREVAKLESVRIFYVSVL